MGREAGGLAGAPHRRGTAVYARCASDGRRPRLLGGFAGSVRRAHRLGRLFPWGFPCGVGGFFGTRGQRRGGFLRRWGRRARFPRRRGPLILHGEADTIVPVSRAYRLREAVLAGGGEVEMQIYPGAHHAFAAVGAPAYSEPAAADSWRRTIEFLRRRLVRRDWSRPGT